MEGLLQRREQGGFSLPRGQCIARPHFRVVRGREYAVLIRVRKVFSPYMSLPSFPLLGRQDLLRVAPNCRTKKWSLLPVDCQLNKKGRKPSNLSPASTSAETVPGFRIAPVVTPFGTSRRTPQNLPSLPFCTHFFLRKISK